MAKTIVIKDSTINELVLGDKHIHYSSPEQQRPEKQTSEQQVEDVTYEEVQQGFPLLTDQCRKDNKVAAIEAEIRAACQGTAVELWRVLRLNEVLGYVAVSHLTARAIYNAITDYFGQLPYNERNFRDARSKK